MPLACELSEFLKKLYHIESARIKFPGSIRRRLTQSTLSAGGESLF